jgi:hypothetical protein
LRIRRLHHHDLHAALLLHRNRLVLVTVQRTSGKRILPQRLNRRHHRLLIVPKYIPQCGIVIYIRRHHLNDSRKVNE